ncbi:MAG: hypothetical protein EA382_06580 [Spirochaetaceae bacterium]|nr:MAG: hypothetical protein EA382_06580 [Spirochaetaceae bacterium]
MYRIISRGLSDRARTRPFASGPRPIALIALLVALSCAGAFADVIQIARPTVSPASAETRRFIDEQMMRAITTIEATDPGLAIRYDGFALRTAPVSARTAPAVRVRVLATRADGQTMIVLNGDTADGRSESAVHQLSWNELLHRELASMIRFLHGVLTADAPPVGSLTFLQDFTTDYIATGDLPATSFVQPYSLTGLPGRLMIAAGSIVLETDPFFREQAKLGVGPELTGAWATHADVTPAGTVFAASMAQQGLVRIVPEIPTPFRLPTRSTVMNLAVTDDGSVFTLDMNQTFVRIAGQSVQQVRLDLPQGTYVSFIAAGPDNTLIVWEPTHRAFFTFDTDGNRLGMMHPHLSMSTAIGLRAFSPYPNGDIIALFLDRIARIARDGGVMWEVLADDLPEVGQLMMHTGMHVDHESGLVYLLNIQLKRISQLIDVDAIQEQRALTDTERRLLDSNEKLRRNPYDQSALAERASLYEEIEAWEAAAYVWETAYAIDPTRRAIAERRDAVLLKRLEENAERLFAQTIDLLESRGPASAAWAYQRAQTEFESLIGRAPGNDAARQRLAELRRAYERASAPPDDRPPLSIQEVAIGDLFPALYAVYQTTPAGSVVVRNDGTSAIDDVRVTVEMRYLEFPTPGGSAARIEPGESATLALRVPISADSLRIQESSPVPVRVSLSYRVDGQERDASVIEVVTLHRATALTWDDSGKLAAFVTPRDPIVEAFAAAFTDIDDARRFHLSGKLFRAALIADAVGAIGLQYVEDPVTGITEVLGNPTVVDTVRFPRNTLRLGIGDCDDTTALLSSLYEAVGISTAIMTSPAHVFLAFDTGEPEANRWLFESPDTRAIAHNGTIWLPFETTILDQGFLASWREGSRLYGRYEPLGQIEFLPVIDQWQRFPPLPLADPSFSVAPPPRSLVEPRYAESLTDVTAVLYERSVRELESELAGRAGAAAVRTLNRLGILHGVFAEIGAAESSFRRALSIDPNHRAAYINLANLDMLAGDPASALAWLDDADRIRPGGALVTLLRAQAYHLAGDRAAATRQMTMLAEASPELYALNIHLVGDQGGTRASDAAGRASFPWAVEDE